MSASQLLPAVAGPDDGTKAGSACSRRTSGPVGPEARRTRATRAARTPPRRAALEKQEIQHLINQEFGVEYHPVYLGQFLKTLGLSYAIPRTKRPSRPENAEEVLDERVGDAFNETEADKPHNKRDDDDEEGWVVNDIYPDGGTVIGFFDTSHPQPWDNSQRLYSVDDPHITRPLVRHDEPTVGFYALNGESVVSFPDQTKERICDCLERIREQNPAPRILLVLDNFSSHICEYTRRRAHQLGIDLVFLPLGRRI